MLKRLLEPKPAPWAHRVAYLGLSLSHFYAALATGKPEIYLPMAACYVILYLKG